MLELFRLLVKRETPDFIIDMSCVSHKGLNAVTCKWAREGKYYVAKAFYTDLWIAGSPFPTQSQVSKSVSEISIRDISDVVMLNSHILCTEYPIITKADVQSLVFQLTKSVRDRIVDTVVALDTRDEFDYTMNIVPCLSMFVTVRNKGVVIGTLLVFSSGEVLVGFACESRIYVYRDMLVDGFNNLVFHQFNGGHGITPLALCKSGQ